MHFFIIIYNFYFLSDSGSKQSPRSSGYPKSTSFGAPPWKWKKNFLPLLSEGVSFRAGEVPSRGVGVEPEYTI
ncbi:MAG: hypothetical protein Q8S84_00280 [bacterium]|nr:hypothetical protein [bacterium]